MLIEIRVKEREREKQKIIKGCEREGKNEKKVDKKRKKDMNRGREKKRTTREG